MKTKIALSTAWLLVILIVAKLAGSVTVIGHINFIQTLIVCSLISVIASCWVYVLTDENMIFGWFRQWLYCMVDNASWTGSGVDMQKKNRLLYFLKPIIDCELCVTGHLAFWVYATIAINNGQFVIFDFLSVISLSILFTVIQTDLWQNQNQDKEMD